MSEGSNTSLLYPIGRFFAGSKRHLNPVMDAELLVQRIANKISPEPIRRQERHRLLQPLIRNGSVEQWRPVVGCAQPRRSANLPAFVIAFTVNESSARNELYKSIDSLILLIGLAFLSGRIPSS